MGLGTEVGCDPRAVLPVGGPCKGPGTGPEATGCGGVTGLALTWPLPSDPRPQGGGDPVPEPCTQAQPQARAPAGPVVPRGHSFPAAWPAGPRWAVRGDSCSGLRFPMEPASGLATSSVPCDPVVARRGFLGWSAGLSSQCLSNRLPPGGQWRKSIAKKQKQASCLPAVKLFMALEAAAWTAAYPEPGSRSRRALPPVGAARGDGCRRPESQDQG